MNNTNDIYNKAKELYDKLDSIMAFLNYHNKNLTKAQYEKLLDLQDLQNDYSYMLEDIKNYLEEF